MWYLLHIFIGLPSYGICTPNKTTLYGLQENGIIAWNSASLTMGSNLSCCKMVLFPVYGAITLWWVEGSPVAFTELDCL